MKTYLDQCINYLKPISIIDMSTKKDCRYLPLTAVDYETLARLVDPRSPKSADGLWIPIDPLHIYLNQDNNPDLIFFEAKSLNTTILNMSLLFGKQKDKKDESESQINTPAAIKEIVEGWNLEKKITDSFDVFNTWIEHNNPNLPNIPQKIKAIFYIVYEYDKNNIAKNLKGPKMWHFYAQITKSKNLAISEIKTKINTPSLANFDIRIMEHPDFLNKFV